MRFDVVESVFSIDLDFVYDDVVFKVIVELTGFFKDDMFDVDDFVEYLNRVDVDDCCKVTEDILIDIISNIDVSNVTKVRVGCSVEYDDGFKKTCWKTAYADFDDEVIDDEFED